MKRLVVLVTVVVLLGFISTTSYAAAPYYQGKTLRVTVGFSAGGGFDLWARVVARHLGKHIPGNPTVIVENVTGAGGLIQVNQLFKAHQTGRPDPRPHQRRTYPGADDGPARI